MTTSMFKRGDPVVILFILAIGGMFYNYIYETTQETNRLTDLIHKQHATIEEQNKHIRELSVVVEYLYLTAYGRGVPENWTELKDPLSPVH